MNKETIIEKIQKLLAKAEGTNNPNESAAFFGKAQALKIQHQIDEAELECFTSEEEFKTEAEPLNTEDKGKRQVATWKASLGIVLTKNNGCFLYQSGPRLVITGKPSDVATVRYMYSYCVGQINRITKANCKGLGATYANNFRLGCVDAIHKAINMEIKAKKEQYSGNERALVVIDKVLVDAKQAESFVRAGANLRQKASNSRYNSNARSHGRQAGSGIYGGSSTRIGNQKLLN